MRTFVRHVLTFNGIGLLLVAFMSNAAELPAIKPKVAKEPPALRACFENCKAYKDESSYEKCMNQCTDTHKTPSTPRAN